MSRWPQLRITSSSHEKGRVGMRAQELSLLFSLPGIPRAQTQDGHRRRRGGPSVSTCCPQLLYILKVPRLAPGIGPGNIFCFLVTPRGIWNFPYQGLNPCPSAVETQEP